LLKNLKKWLLILGLTGPTVVNLSCSSALLEQFRDAAISGAASFVEQTTLDLLDQSLFPPESDE